jgi:hypothetical protein
VGRVRAAENTARDRGKTQRGDPSGAGGAETAGDFRRHGLEAWRSTPEEFGRLLIDERVKWQKVIANNIEAT